MIYDLKNMLQVLMLFVLLYFFYKIIECLTGNYSPNSVGGNSYIEGFKSEIGLLEVNFSNNSNIPIHHWTLMESNSSPQVNNIISDQTMEEKEHTNFVKPHKFVNTQIKPTHQFKWMIDKSDIDIEGDVLDCYGTLSHDIREKMTISISTNTTRICSPKIIEERSKLLKPTSVKIEIDPKSEPSKNSDGNPFITHGVFENSGSGWIENKDKRNIGTYDHLDENSYAFVKYWDGTNYIFIHLQNGSYVIKFNKPSVYVVPSSFPTSIAYPIEEDCSIIAPNLNVSTKSEPVSLSTDGKSNNKQNKYNNDCDCDNNDNRDTLAYDIVDVPPSFADATTYYHNWIRSHFNAAKISWENPLADSSQLHAKYLAENQTFEHGKNLNGIGENLYEFITMGTIPTDLELAQKACISWFNEYNEYKKEYPTDQTGHFTQMVWKCSKTLGGGRSSYVDSDGWTHIIVVMRYSPGGNVTNHLKEDKEHYDECYVHGYPNIVSQLPEFVS